jgi:hypothetical protein
VCCARMHDPDDVHQRKCKRLQKRLDKCKGVKCDRITKRMESLGCLKKMSQSKHCFKANHAFWCAFACFSCVRYRNRSKTGKLFSLVRLVEGEARGNEYQSKISQESLLNSVCNGLLSLKCDWTQS